MKPMDKKKIKKLELFFEFVIFGIIVGVVEDLIAVKLATGATITWNTIVIVILVTIPFAAIGELIIDNVDFSKLITRFLHKRNRSEK